MILIVLAVCWLVGLVVADTVELPTAMLLGVAATGGLGGLVLRGRPQGRLVLLGLACAALAGARLNSAQLVTTPQSVALLAGGEVALRGAIAEDPKRTEEGQQVVLQVQAALAGGAARPAEGLVLLNLPPYPEYRYGQLLLVKGDLKRPREPKRPGEFDYRAYLARKGIAVLMREPQVRRLPGEEGLRPLRLLLDFRDHCKGVLLRLLPEPQASLAVGILLGLQASIPDDVYATFSATGTSHILVVSGWNFTIVAAMLAGVTTRLGLGRSVTFWASLGVLWTYALFVGATGTVLRAALMASLMVLARSTERQSEPWTLLFAACWLLTAWNPNALWDLGFQLSALATASLFAFGKPTEEWLHRCPPLRSPWLGWATEALGATLAAQILALPPILYHFGNLSIISPLANVVLVPVVPYVMLLATVALLGGLLWLPLGQVLAWGAWLPLAWLSEGARLLAQVPGAAVTLPPFPLWVLLGYYAIVVGGWLWGQRAGTASDDG